METVLVTGAAGFIGSRLSQYLLNQGYNVIGIDNLNDYYDIRLKKRRLKLINNSNFKFLLIDIENYSDLKNLFKQYKFKSIFNLAARAGVRYSIENPHVYMNTNLIGTLNLLECMKENNCVKMVLASTSSLYSGQIIPFHEDLPVNNPISPYAASKKAAEVLSYTYHNLYDINVTILRYFTVYGPFGRPDMSIFRFIKWIETNETIQLFGDGTQSRDFTYIDDIVEGTIASSKLKGYQIINLGGGEKPIQLLEIIKIIEKILNKKANIQYMPFNKADLIQTQSDTKKAKQLIQWNAKISIEKGIKNSIDWYLLNKKWINNLFI